MEYKRKGPVLGHTEDVSDEDYSNICSFLGGVFAQCPYHGERGRVSFFGDRFEVRSKCGCAWRIDFQIREI